MIGVSEASVSLYETGKREPSNDTLKFFADLYGVTVDYLLVVSIQNSVHRYFFANLLCKYFFTPYY